MDPCRLRILKTICTIDILIGYFDVCDRGSTESMSLLNYTYLVWFKGFFWERNIGGRLMSRTYIIEPSLILRTGHIKKCTELFTLESLKINKNTIVVVPIGAPEIFSKNSKIAVKKILPNSYEQILYDQKLYSNSLSLFMKVLFFYLLIT